MISETDPLKCLARFAAAWAERDVDALLELMTDDAVYAASVGPEPGRTFRCYREPADGFRAMFAHDAGAVAEQGEPVVMSDRTVSTWTYRFGAADGPGRCERGIDLWQFRDGKICVKDAYRKVAG